MTDKLTLIAKTEGNWDMYADADGTLYSIAKPGSGCISSYWCSASRLRGHLRHLANLKHGSHWESMIPEHWEVVQPDYFTALGIH